MIPAVHFDADLIGIPISTLDLHFRVEPGGEQLLVYGLGSSSTCATMSRGSRWKACQRLAHVRCHLARGERDRVTVRIEAWMPRLACPA